MLRRAKRKQKVSFPCALGCADLRVVPTGRVRLVTSERRKSTSF